MIIDELMMMMMMKFSLTMLVRLKVNSAIYGYSILMSLDNIENDIRELSIEYACLAVILATIVKY
jgi:hypothetical protein